jgi:hypothetical protein
VWCVNDHRGLLDLRGHTSIFIFYSYMKSFFCFSGKHEKCSDFEGTLVYANKGRHWRKGSHVAQHIGRLSSLI